MSIVRIIHEESWRYHPLGEPLLYCHTVEKNILLDAYSGCWILLTAMATLLT